MLKTIDNKALIYYWESHSLIPPAWKYLAWELDLIWGPVLDEDCSLQSKTFANTKVFGQLFYCEIIIKISYDLFFI